MRPLTTVFDHCLPNNDPLRGKRRPPIHGSLEDPRSLNNSFLDYCLSDDGMVECERGHF
ncbi:hypothetical protein Q7M82_05640 (plasmid) [Candidatus Liberibacter asiaticus]|nr:hypothetical protein [Candidatus Liberibacter asiaticus]MBA2918017.1 hypothetical protein [Candidatus Liberibacter asiaticus]